MRPVRLEEAMPSRLSAGELAALERVDAELLARWVGRLRAHAPGSRLGLLELSVLCAAFAAESEEESAELFDARVALASFSDRHPELELDELVEAFAEAEA